MGMYGHGPQYPYHQPPPATRPPRPPGLSPVAIVLIVVGGLVVLGTGAILLAVALAVSMHTANDAAGAVDAGAVVEKGAPSTQSDPPQPNAAADESAAEAPQKDQAPVTGGGKAGAKAKPSAGSWSCTASASVRVCGFAGACNYQMVFGNGFGSDRFVASQQAKSSCEASARAKGASAVCVVQCSAR